jgi:hypothetical protein
MKALLIFFLSLSLHATEVPTQKEALVFKNYLQKSGLLLKNHKIKFLNPGPSFQVMRHACKDADDIYILSFDLGITLTTPKNESIPESYPSGTGGSWTLVFKHSPKLHYFHFVGANVHRWAGKVLGFAENAQCPDIEVGVHGSFCHKAGAAECWGSLQYDNLKGYELKTP